MRGFPQGDRSQRRIVGCAENEEIDIAREPARIDSPEGDQHAALQYEFVPVRRLRQAKDETLQAEGDQQGLEVAAV